MRRIIVTLVIAALAAVGLGGIAVATSSGSSITKPRLERSVAATFSNVYSQQAALLGHKGITPASLHAKTMCDKGPGLAQSGPGTGWICLTSWTDPNTPMPPTGYGKLEVSVHSNGCYSVGSPSSLIGYQTITDARGRTVNNPAYEFDGCLDPRADNKPTGVTFPSELKITSTTATPDQWPHPRRHLLRDGHRRLRWDGHGNSRVRGHRQGAVQHHRGCNQESPHFRHAAR